MKISLGKLEEARLNPSAFKANINNTFRGGYGRFQALKNAALHYHKTQSASDAQNYLAEQFQKHFTSRAAQKSRPSYVAQLEEYIILFNQRGIRVVDRRYNLELNLPPNLSSQIVCSGQLPLLCNSPTTGDLQVWFYTQKQSPSRNDIGLPLIQAEISRRMQADLEEVTVGFYHFLSGRFTKFQFTQDEVDDAQAELEILLNKLI